MVLLALLRVHQQRLQTFFMLHYQSRIMYCLCCFLEDADDLLSVCVRNFCAKMLSYRCKYRKNNYFYFLNWPL